MPKPGPQKLPDHFYNECLQEYNALRAEIIKRMEIRNSIVFGTLTFASALMGFGLNTPALALIYIIISMFLAAAWVQSDVMISQTGRYIRENIEKYAPGLRWESTRAARRTEEKSSGGIRPSVVFSTSGIFILTQNVALIIAMLKIRSFGLLDWILCAIALVCEILTIYFFRVASRSD